MIIKDPKLLAPFGFGHHPLRGFEASLIPTSPEGSNVLLVVSSDQALYKNKLVRIIGTGLSPEVFKYLLVEQVVLLLLRISIPETFGTVLAALHQNAPVFRAQWKGIKITLITMKTASTK